MICDSRRVWVHAEHTHTCAISQTSTQTLLLTRTNVYNSVCGESLYRSTSFFKCYCCWLVFFLLVALVNFYLFVWRLKRRTTAYGIPFTTRATINSTLTAIYLTCILYFHSYQRHRLNTMPYYFLSSALFVSYSTFCT